ncbi:hypothetical protein ACHAWF_006250 [Thalassiosira exigua]
MAIVSPAVFAPPAESSPSPAVPAAATATTGDGGGGARAAERTEADEPAELAAPSSSAAPDESTQGALDALAALAAASSSLSGPHARGGASPHRRDRSHPQHLRCAQQQQQQQPYEITPHQTSSDDDSEAMPPPPPRGPVGASTTYRANPCFSLLHDSDVAFHASTAGGGGGRLRSASNPEGMEKWDLYSRRNDRQHFVLPSSILEEELASTRRVLGETVAVADNDEYDEDCGMRGGGREGSGNGVLHGFAPPPPLPRAEAAEGFHQHWVRRSSRRTQPSCRLGTSPDSVAAVPAFAGGAKGGNPPSRTSPATKPAGDRSGGTAIASAVPADPPPRSRKKRAASPPEIIPSKSPPPEGGSLGREEDADESTLEPEELLRRARSRLLEDLSEGGDAGGGGGGTGAAGGGGGGTLILPHSLSKYKEVYNQNGRIGIYTPAERAAIIRKFRAKRARRVWNKKIRYNCRKNLADRRMRVKGRFVKRSVEATEAETGDGGSLPPHTGLPSQGEGPYVAPPKATARSGSQPTHMSPLTTVNEGVEGSPPLDEAMPDVGDEEAGFEPTDDMPFRRTRRYTIT